jgi:hypothetical protein
VYVAQSYSFVLRSRNEDIELSHALVIWDLNSAKTKLLLRLGQSLKKLDLGFRFKSPRVDS